MRITKHTINSHGGYDYAYQIACDICGEKLKKKSGRNLVDAEFLTCGEEWYTALAAGWIGDQDCVICTACQRTIGG